MKKLALIIASSVFAVSLAGTGAAFAQSTPATPDTNTAAPATPDTTAPVHKKKVKHPKAQKTSMHKHKAKKKMAPKKPAEPTNDDSTQQPAQ